MGRKKPMSIKDYLERYPRICAHIMAESTGYYPRGAAHILRDFKNGKKFDGCAWIYFCYNGRIDLAVKDAIRYRHYHTGYSHSYKQCYKKVRAVIRDPLLYGW